MGILDAIFGPGEIEFTSEKITEGFRILAKGKFPAASYGKNVSWHTAVRDTESGLPILSLFEQAREPKNLIYSFSTDPQYDGGLYYPDWTVIGVVISSCLQGPYQGNREIDIEVVLYDTSYGFPFERSYCTEQRAVCGVKNHTEWHNFDSKGYMESIEDEAKSKELSIEIMMGIAMSDGHLDDAEGNIIKKYIEKEIEMLENDEDKKEKKKFYNDILRTTHKKFINKKTTFNDIKTTIQRLHEMKDDSINRSTIALCYDIMAADGKVQNEELEILNKINDFLKIDKEFTENIFNKKMLSLDLTNTSGENYEVTLGINKSWDKKQIISFLNKEFLKWNNRLNVISDEKEKENAQHMLHMIAEVKKKYAS
jgi:uncharacterized tellurite resistance protein B-like protein